MLESNPDGLANHTGSNISDVTSVKTVRGRNRSVKITTND
jgi:hypothetical protein